MTVQGPRARSQRDAAKDRTRSALIDAALHLFATQGYDSTTAEAIAERAGVTARTFFRHFETKERVLFRGEEHFYRSFREQLAEQPRELSDLAAITAAFVAVAPTVEQLRDRFTQYRAATARSSTLRGREQEVLDQQTAANAAAIGRRRGLSCADDTCRATAAVTLTMVELSIADWSRTAVPVPLGPIITDRFRILSELSDGDHRDSCHRTDTNE